MKYLERILTPAYQKTDLVRTGFRILLGVSLMFAGIAHLSFQRVEFLAQVPNWVPIGGDLVVILSGIIEFILGLALVFFPRYRIIIGWLASSFFVIIFPGNISQFINGIDAFGLDTDQARFLRLFFQPMLVIWALWSTQAWRDSPEF